MLQVWLRAQHSPLAVWHTDTQEWHSVTGWQQLYDTYHKGEGRDNTLCLYFPSSHLLQVDTELSTAQLKQLGNTGKQYLFEESSLTPIEQLAIRQIGHASIHHLYALAQHDIERWEQSAALVGLSVSALLPDFLLLPIPEEGAGQQVVLYQDQHTTLLRQSQHQGLAVSYLPLIIERLPHLSEVCLLPAIPSLAPSAHTPDSSTADTLTEMVGHSIDLQQLTSAPAIETQTNMAAETAALLAEQQILLTTLALNPTPLDVPERHGLNFFIRSADTQLAPYLRLAVMVALAALVLQIATDGLQAYHYNKAAKATQAAVITQYQSWFPNETLNTSRTKLPVQMSAKLRSDAQASASHLDVLARVSPLIKQSSLHAQALIMEPTALRFTLIAPDRGSLDEFASTLSAQGMTAALERVNSNEQGQFSGQLVVNIVPVDEAAQS